MKVAQMARAGASTPAMVVVLLILALAQFAMASPAEARAAAATASSGFRYLVEPAPAWVVPAPESDARPREASPMHYRVIDDQIRIEGRSVSAYTRLVRVANDAAGVSAASQLEVVFDPTYETVALHHLDVVRGGKRLNRLDRKRIQLLQRETQLERRVYDGRVTVSIVIDDVRAGDHIDFAYSRRGANPVFEGKFIHGEWMTSPRGPVNVHQLRLLVPADRAIRHRVVATDIQVTEKPAGAWRETVFRREATPQLQTDEHAPSSAVLAHQVQFTEFADWADVARWGERLFAEEGAAPALDREAAQIRAQSAERPAQVLAALAFVQREIRYFGTEMGANSHRPALPAKVLEQRFGDCKDKVALLMALLRRLGVAAEPVLVSTVWREDVEQFLPSPLAFDHVIARVQLDGKTYWLDPTRTYQSGTLDKRQTLGLGKGLLLAAGAQALVSLPEPFDAERLVIQDRFRVESFKRDPVLESRITYYGELAEAFREWVASRGLPSLESELASTYLKMYPKAQASAGMRVEETPDSDAITFVQTFTVGEFWRFPEERVLVGEVAAWGPGQALDFRKSEARRDAYGVRFPGIYRHTITVEYPEDVYERTSSEHEEVNDPHFALRVSMDGGLRRSAFEAELRIGATQIPPVQWKSFMAKVDAARKNLTGMVAVPALRLDQLEGMKRTVQKLDEDLRSRRIKVRTAQQTKALVKSEILSAQLAGGRLPPALEAQALTERGMQYDHLGRLEAAKADFERALALAPDSLEAQNAAAVNAVGRRDMAGAIALASRVLERDARNTDALRTRGRAYYFQKDWPRAESDYLTLLKDSASVRSGFPLVWLSLTLRQRGQDPAKLATDYPSDRLPTDWPRPLVDFMLGKASAESVIQAAQAAKNPAEPLCEAYFYIGELHFAAGDVARATEFWRKAVDQGVVEYVEDSAARLRLESVGKR